LEITNLNRIRAGLPDLGMNKTDIAAKNAWEVDPFLDLDLWPEGITEKTLQKFMSKPRLDVFIDEMDNIGMKIMSRNVCRELGIPVVMATDNGDGAIIDVERFDEDPARPIFHGRVNVDEFDTANMTREAFIKMANAIIDPKLFTARQLSSIQSIGTQISGVPQIGTAASIAGAAAAYAVRQILTKQHLPSGRYIIGCEQAFMKSV
jgi:molybdopterin/thiamine biosynthesis adenylyltransferase